MIWPFYRCQSGNGDVDPCYSLDGHVAAQQCGCSCGLLVACLLKNEANADYWDDFCSCTDTFYRCLIVESLRAAVALVCL
jgi:hypothetical protein